MSSRPCAELPPNWGWLGIFNNMSESTSNRRLTSLLPMMAGIVFFLALVGSLFFLFYGISPAIESYTRGYIGARLVTNGVGEVVLDPTPGLDAANAGVEKGDILLSINGQPIPPAEENLTELIRGSIGEPVIITVRKSDGSVQTLSIVRSSEYRKTLDNAGVTANFLAGYFVILSLLIGLGFAGMGVLLLLRCPTDWLFVLTAFTLLFYPYSLTATIVAHSGAILAGLDWLYNLLRAVGLFLTVSLLFVFPNGQFVPKWTRGALVVIAIWIVPYYIALIVENFLPGTLLDVACVIILALGVAVQIYRYLRVSTETERQQTRSTLIAALVALLVYLLVWLIATLLPKHVLSSAGWVWYYLIVNLLVDAALLFLGGSLARSMWKVE